MNINSNQLRYYLLKKQNLFLKSPQKEIIDVLSRIGGIYSSAPTCHLSLMNRITDYNSKKLNDLLGKNKKIGRMALMRGTIYILPINILPLAFIATKSLNELLYASLLLRLGIDEDEYKKAKRRINKALKGKQLSAREIGEEIKPWKEPARGALSYIIKSLCAEGHLIRTVYEGSWLSNKTKYALFKEWFPGLSLKSSKLLKAQTELARFYFKAFGPALWDDFQWWTGLNQAEVDKIKPQLEGEINKIKIDDLPEARFYYYDEEPTLKQVKIPRRKAVNFLPYWDAYLMGYKNRDHFVDPAWQNYIYDQDGNSTYTILINGKAEGIWDLFRNGNDYHIKIALFDSKNEEFFMNKKSLYRIFKSFLDSHDLLIELCPLPKENTFSGSGKFLSPLKDVSGKVFSV